MQRGFGIIIIGVLVSSLVLLGLGNADTDTDIVTVDVEVGAQTRIDVSPNSISWAATEPGTTNDTHFSLDLENIGTRNITNVYVDSSNANSNPYGTADPSFYNSSEFVLFNTTSNATFYYADTKCWNETKPGFITAPSGWSEGYETGHFGKFRTVSLGSRTADEGEQYYWFTSQDPESGNCSNGSIYFASRPKNSTDDGTTDFTGVTPETLSTTDWSWGYADIDNGGNAELQEYSVGVSSDCSEVVIFKYNNGLCTSCADADYLYAGNLMPGSSTFFWVALKVPQGIPDGNLDQGIMTFTAEGT